MHLNYLKNFLEFYFKKVIHLWDCVVLKKIIYLQECVVINKTPLPKIGVGEVPPRNLV